MSLLRKLSIIPVALAAMYLFACKSGEVPTQLEPDVSDIIDVIDVIDVEEEEVEEVLFALVQEKPLFNGEEAETAFRQYVNEHIVYPPEAQENGISGRVFVEFTIDRDGSVINVTLLRGPDQLLSNEALRVVSSSPKWTPGKHRGKTVRVIYQFQLAFRLNN